MLYSGADASTPGFPLPAGTSVLAAYVGGDTPRVWSAADWNKYLKAYPSLRVLPIYTHNYTAGNPVADATTAVEAVEALGWARYPAPRTRCIVIDVETVEDYDYFNVMGDTIDRAGYRPVLYGSKSTITSNPVFSGYWVADYDYTSAPASLPSNYLGLQWGTGADWNKDVFTESLYLGCGQGLRHG